MERGAMRLQYLLVEVFSDSNRLLTRLKVPGLLLPPSKKVRRSKEVEAL